MGKKSKKNTLYTIILLVLIGIAALVAELITTSEEKAVPTTVAAAALVETTHATTESSLPYELPRLVNNQPEQVIRHLGYTVSYNPDWLVPNWVAYELTNAETSGEQERKNRTYGSCRRYEMVRTSHAREFLHDEYVPAVT